MTLDGTLIVDTSGWASLVDVRQQYHDQAVEYYRGHHPRFSRFLTTNYVILELVSLLTSPMGMSRPRVIELINGMLESQRIEVVHIDPAIHEKAWSLLLNRPDKSWSLVDCASFVVMHSRELANALTSDLHFEQAGFIRLLKKS